MRQIFFRKNKRIDKSCYTLIFEVLSEYLFSIYFLTLPLFPYFCTESENQ
jgi:hypothetical protein